MLSAASLRSQVEWALSELASLFICSAWIYFVAIGYVIDATNLRNGPRTQVLDEDPQKPIRLAKPSDHLPNLLQLWPPDRTVDDHEVEIIAVHGLGANPATTWKKGEVNWLNDPKMLPSMVPHARIWTFNFQSDLFGQAPLQRLSTLGDQLLEIVIQKLRDGRRPIIFVAHSFGGVVVAQALCSAEAKGRTAISVLDLVTGAVFLGAPFRPSPATDLGKLFLTTRELFGYKNSDSKQLLNDISAKEKMLDLSSRFDDLAQNSRLDICCFFEQFPMPFFNKAPQRLGHFRTLVRRFSMILVPEEMACLGSFPRLGLGTSHTQMNEFDDPEDGNYQLVSGKLAEFAEISFEKIKARHREAGERSPIFSMPYLRNPDFVGREEILDELHRKLDWKKDDTQARAALCGLGGVGKTQIAIKYAYSRRRKFALDGTSVYWIQGSTRERFETSYLDLARKAKISIVTGQDRFLEIMEWLQDEGNGRWLMIIDNADDADLFNDVMSEDGEQVTGRGLSQYIPRCAHGSILFSSRDKKACVDLVGARSWIQVDRLKMADCRKLLKNSLGDGQWDESADNLIVNLEYLPLALSQAISYMAKRDVTVTKYLQMYAESESACMELLGENFQASGRDSIPNAVAATLMITLNQIDSKEPLAASLLGYMSLLNRQDIPKALLPIQDQTPKQYENAIDALAGYSLIALGTSDDSYTIHGLVQLVMHKWLHNKERLAESISKVLDVVTYKYPEPPGQGQGGGLCEDLTLCEPYLPHVLSILHYVEAQAHDETEMTIQTANGKETKLPKSCHKMETLKEVSLLLKTGRYLIVWGQYWDAEPFMIRAVHISTNILGPDAEVTLTAMHDLSVIYLAQFRPMDAENLLEKILARRDRSAVESHEGLTTLSNLAAAISDQGRLEEAEELQRDILEVQLEKYGVDNWRTQTYMHNLAITQQDQGRYIESEDLHRKVLEEEKKVHGPYWPKLLLSMSSLASCLRDMGELDEAEDMFRDALTKQRKVLGDEHPRTLKTLRGLAHTLVDKGRYDEARIMYTEVYEAKKEMFDSDHREVLSLMGDITLTLEKAGAWGSAETMRREILDRLLVIAGEKDPSTLEAKYMLANNWINRDQHKKAKEMLRSVLEERRVALGPDDDLTLDTARILSEWEARPKRLDISDQPSGWAYLNEEARKRDMGESVAPLRCDSSYMKMAFPTNWR